MTPTVYVIDDDASFLRSMGRRLRSHGYTVETYQSVADFLSRPAPESPGCVLTDLQMPKRDGFELQESLAKTANPLPSPTIWKRTYPRIHTMCHVHMAHPSGNVFTMPEKICLAAGQSVHHHCIAGLGSSGLPGQVRAL